MIPRIADRMIPALLLVALGQRAWFTEA